MKKRILWLLSISLVFTLLLVLFVYATFSSITLNSPANNTVTSDTTPDFNFTGISTVNVTMSCSAIVDGASVATNGATANDTATVLTSTALAEGSHNWNINCTDTDETSSSEIRTIIVDVTLPTSTISAPADNTNTSDTTPQITFTLTDNIDTSIDYDIYVDGTINGQIGAVANNTPTNLNLSALTEGTHTVVVQATDDAGNDINSTALTINVDATVPTSAISAPTNNTNTTCSMVLEEMFQ